MNILSTILVVLLSCAALTIIGAVLFRTVYISLTASRRQWERGRFFLDVLESGLAVGRSPEQSVISLSQSGDRELGKDFHLLAARLETGLRVGQALNQAPPFLPPRIQAALQVGEELGDIKKVLPMCRRRVSDGLSQMQSLMSYSVLYLLAFVLLPVFFFLFQHLVFPKFVEIMHSYSITSLPPFANMLFGGNSVFLLFQIPLIIAFILGYYLHANDPRWDAWLKSKFAISAFDRINFCVPWKRMRMQRDFSTTLALLLDAEVPESRSVQLAAQSTGNIVFGQRAGKVMHELAEGKKLSDAMEAFDDTGEFRWRLKNAASGSNRFLSALSGWLEALDVKAFQQEQAAAQVLSTIILLLNGVLVGLVVASVFQLLIRMINEVTLW